jgi:hypothetical protein
MGAFRTVSYGVDGVFYRLVSSSNSQVSYQLIWKLTLLLLCLLSTTTKSTTAKKKSRFDVNGEVRVDAVRYRKYITGTDRRSIRNPDFLRNNAEIKLV